MTSTQLGSVRRGRGGRRPGAGRKPLNSGRVNAAFGLTPRHLDMIEQWRQSHGCSSASEALRQILEAAAALIL